MREGMSEGIPGSPANKSSYDGVCSSHFEHYLLLSVVLLVFLLGFLGNLLVIVATMYRKAFSGDNISIVFVRNLALADLMYIFVQVIPDFTVRMSGHTWMLGDLLCAVSAHAVYIPGIANISFIFSISIYRLLSCMFPFHFRETISIRQANLYSVVVWCYSLIPTLVYISQRPAALFEPMNSDCSLDFARKNLVNLCLGVPLVIIPFFGLIVCNVSLYVIARKSAARIGRSARQATLTIGAVSGLFVVSWLPYITRKIVMVVSDVDLNLPLRPDVLFYELSIFGNPIIYTVVNPRFRTFLKNKLSKLLRPGHKSIKYVSRDASQPTLAVKSERDSRANDIMNVKKKQSESTIVFHE